MKRLVLCGALALVGACSPAPTEREQGTVAETPAPPSKAPQPLLSERAPTQANGTPRQLIGQQVALAEWRKAANRARCAPLALADDAGAPATARRAHFSQGWGVAFDQPNRRSAYGFAGAGLLPADGADFAGQVDALVKQWPYLRRWDGGENLPAGSTAGYGLMGAARYSDANPDGRGEHSLAYLRIPGQSCLYNVWSRISRAHLEALLNHLRIVNG